MPTGIAGSKTPPRRVVICDDSATIRSLLIALIAQLPAVELVGEAADGDEVLDVVTATDPDVLVVDFDMPGRNGAQAIQELRRQGFRGTAILFTGSSGSEVPALAFDAGADAVVHKDTVGDLISALMR